ncbi:TPA: AAA family ATPase, partial [Clostridioides difficile]
MRLIKMRLFNFRAFYNETPWIHFASGEKNVTVIHCENGVGKTNLLNVFTWGFYKSITEDMDEPNELVNKKALGEANIGDVVECWVEIHFEHYSKKYTLKRTLKVKKTGNPSDW